MFLSFPAQLKGRGTCPYGKKLPNVRWQKSVGQVRDYGQAPDLSNRNDKRREAPKHLNALLVREMHVMV